MDAGPEVGQRGGHAPLGEGLFLLGREFLAASPLAWLFRRSFPPRLFHLRPDFRRALLAFCLRQFHQFPIGPALSAHAPRPLFVVGVVYGRQAQADARNPVPAPEILGGFFEKLLGQRVDVGGLRRVFLVEGEVGQLERLDPEVEAERVDRAGADDALDARLGRGLVDIESAGTVDVENIGRGAAHRAGDRREVDDALDAVHLLAGGGVVGDIAGAEVGAGDIEVFVEADDADFVAG